MKSKPIYVELAIKTDMDELWEHTQSPGLHQQWDLRFSEITYLPRGEADPIQKFLYRTRIGFGLDIAGTGETKPMIEGREGQRISTLTFGTDNKFSLIRQGGGYWKYKPGTQGEGIVFITQFDYRTRFGLAGRWIDRLLFRPLFGYATAWSFDRLRIRLENKIAPAISMERTITHYVSVLMLMLLWMYQGIVPKLMYPEAGEMTLLRNTGWFPGMEEIVLTGVGIAEIGLALLIGFHHRRKWVYYLQDWALLGLGLAAAMGTPGLLKDPFNPLTLGLAMYGLGIIAARTIKDLPNAARCIRQPYRSSKIRQAGQGGITSDIDL